MFTEEESFEIDSQLEESDVKDAAMDLIKGNLSHSDIADIILELMEVICPEMSYQEQINAIQTTKSIMY